MNPPARCQARRQCGAAAGDGSACRCGRRGSGRRRRFDPSLARPSPAARRRTGDSEPTIRAAQATGASLMQIDVRRPANVNAALVGPAEAGSQVPSGTTPKGTRQARRRQGRSYPSVQGRPALAVTIYLTHHDSHELFSGCMASENNTPDTLLGAITYFADVDVATSSSPRSAGRMASAARTANRSDMLLRGVPPHLAVQELPQAVLASRSAPSSRTARFRSRSGCPRCGCSSTARTASAATKSPATLA